MTITEQELTLFGGWAKAQTHTQIEIGVYRDLDTVLPSTLREQWKINLRYYTRDAYTPYIPGYDLENDYKEQSLVEVEMGERRKSQISIEVVIESLREELKKSAFVRYAEAWAETLGLDVVVFLRAVSGTEKLRLSFIGMLGSMNGKAIKKIDGKWKIIDRSKLYPKIQPMPEDGIESIRANVAKRREKRAPD